MIDSVQLILLLVIIVITILLVVLGIQVFFILKDFRKTVTKLNKVLDDAGSVTDSVAGPLSSLSTIFTGMKVGSLLTVAKMIRSIVGKSDDEDASGR